MRRGLLGVLARLGAVAVLLVSGGYLVLYLYRWEWNRAFVAGIFFLAAELAVGILAVLDRLGTAAGPAAPRSPTARRFPWLEPDRFSVFVPVLLGAGLLLSLVAWLVERIASATAPRGASPLLARLGAPPPPRTSPGHRALRAVAVLAAVVVLLVGLQVLADLAQARDDPPVPGRALVVDVEIRTRRATPPLPWLAEELRLLCVPSQLGSTVEITGEDTARFVISPAPGRTDHRKLQGCLNDFVLDRTRVRILTEVEVEVGAGQPVPELAPVGGGTDQV